jgi:glutathionylspermidine synthase
MQAVTKALVNGAWGQSPCVLVTENEKEIYVDNPVIIAQCQQLQNSLDSLSEEVVAIRAEAQKKIDFLRDQVAIKDRQIDMLHSVIDKMGFNAYFLIVSDFVTYAKGKNIPVEARIVTVCDVYDALVSERSYKSAWSKGDAMNYLADNSGKIFDPEICLAFIQYLSEESAE